MVDCKYVIYGKIIVDDVVVKGTPGDWGQGSRVRSVLGGGGPQAAFGARLWSESVGFLSQNTVYPDQRAAVVVLTNADFGDVTDTLTEGLADILLPTAAAAVTLEPDRTADARALYDAIVAGKLDRRLITANLNDYFDATTLGDYRSSLAALGPATSIVLLGEPRLRGGFVRRRYRLTAGGKSLGISTFAEAGANGRWEQFIVTPD